MEKVLAVDLDGTLFYPKQRRRLIHPKNVSFIRDFVAKGNRVILVTSRGQGFTEKTLAKLQLDLDYVCRNGAMVVHRGQVLRDQVWPRGVAYPLYLELLKHYPNQAWSADSRQHLNVVHTGDKNRWVRLLYRLYYWSQGIYRESFLSDDDKFIEVLQKEDIYRILVYFGLGKKGVNRAKEALKLVKERFPNIESSWIDGLIEMAPLNCNKASGLQLILDRDNIRPEQVYVVGDSGNDTVLFKKYYAHSYCMKHSHPDIRRQAKYTVGRVYDLAKVLR